MSIPTVSKMKGTGYDSVNIPADPNIMALWKSIQGGIQPGLEKGLGHLGNLAGGGDEQMWNQLEAPAMRQFGQLQGQMGSRFSGMGSGARRSSGFQNTMTGAAGSLAEQLQSQRMNLQNSAIQQLMSMSGQLLQTPLSDTMLMPKKKPFWQDLISGIGAAGGQAAGQFGGLGLSKLAGFI